MVIQLLPERDGISDASTQCAHRYLVQKIVPCTWICPDGNLHDVILPGQCRSLLRYLKDNSQQEQVYSHSMAIAPSQGFLHITSTLYKSSLRRTDVRRVTDSRTLRRSCQMQSSVRLIDQKQEQRSHMS